MGAWMYPIYLCVCNASKKYLVIFGQKLGYQKFENIIFSRVHTIIVSDIGIFTSVQLYTKHPQPKEQSCIDDQERSTQSREDINS